MEYRATLASGAGPEVRELLASACGSAEIEADVIGLTSIPRN
jgi:hypothetical protein